MSCLHHANVKQTMMMWCSGNAKTDDIMPLIPTLHEWHVNAAAMMMTWLTLYVNPSDIMSGMCDAYAHTWCMCSM